MKTNPRRDFLKKSILGLSGAALASGTLKAAPVFSGSKNAVAPIPERILGKSGVKVPVLSMGTGDTKNPALVKAALENGVKLFGTSTYYGNGNNETMLGEVLKDVPRDSFMIATSSMPKGTDHQNGVFTDSTAAEAFQTDIEGSMKRLGVDHLDILFLPFVAKRESVLFEPLLRVMENFKKSGKARIIGIATHSWVDEAIRAAADTGIYDVVMCAYNFRSQQLQEVNDAITYGASKGLGFIAMKSMAGGFWDKERTQPINSNAALKWVMQNENIATMMSGMTTYDQLQTNLAMAQNLKLTDQEMKDLKLADAGQSGGLFCLQCRKCTDQCPQQVDIPTLMRSYMYAYGYRNLDHAQQTLNMVDLSGLPCDRCGSCSVNCTAGFDVKNKILEIARLKDVPKDFVTV
jgi:uncharacterized protein